MRRLVFFALGTLAVGCGIAFSPGDYGGQATPSTVTPNDASPTLDATTDTGPTPTSEAGPPPPAGHVIVAAGDSNAGASNDVWVAPIDAAGELGAFEYLQPAPIRGALLATNVADGKILFLTSNASGHIVELADFRVGITSGWTTATVGSAPNADFAPFFAGTSVVGIGGDYVTQVDDGSGQGTTVPQTNYDNGVYVASYNAVDGGHAYGTVAPSATVLTAAIAHASAVPYKNFLYYFGGSGNTVGADQVFVGTLDPALGLATVAQSKSITTGNGNPYTPAASIPCTGEGHIFLIGGTQSDTVVYAAIDETTGQLSAWKNGPTLPSILAGGGCAIFNGAIHLFGGSSHGVRSDQILRWKFAEDGDGGTGAWETLPQTLPGARANVFALTY